MTDSKNPGRIPAAQADTRLSAIVLAPMKAITSAQMHALRSGLAEFLQMGFPARPAGTEPSRDSVTGEVLPERPYTMDFLQEREEGGVIRRQKVSIPTLALLSPPLLAVKTASYTLDLAVQSIERSVAHTAGNKDTDLGTSAPRPWFLVHEPVELTGRVAAPSKGQDASGEERNEQRLHVEVQLERIPPPAGLDKLLTSLMQSTTVRELPPRPSAPPPPEKP